MSLQYKFYATLLDSFQSYLSSSEIYQQFWGFSENPQLTEEEFEQKQYQDLLDRINRVPFENEATAKGSAFNEVIDCLINGTTSLDWDLSSNKERGVLIAQNEKYNFEFNTNLCRSIRDRLTEGVTQELVEGTLSTKYGEVLLYGYLDYLLPFKVVDLKTTKKYNAFKYKNNWQHIVYPYCLNQKGIAINEFEYMATDLRKVYTESYVFNAEKDVPRLIDHCEAFIEFFEANKDKITDKKIFAKE
ncbi:hypothetical protein ACQ1PF_09680 [Ornithobacterium rhinotracheale]